MSTTVFTLKVSGVILLSILGGALYWLNVDAVGGWQPLRTARRSRHDVYVAAAIVLILIFFSVCLGKIVEFVGSLFGVRWH